MVKRPTKREKPPRILTTRALEHGTNAVGAASMKPKFAFTPEDDLAFALGFPNLKYLYEDEVDPELEASRLKDDYPHLRVAYPIKASLRFLRERLRRNAATPLPSAPDAPMSEDEARALLTETVATFPPPDPEGLYYLVEAHVGPDAAATGLLEGVLAAPLQSWFTHPHLRGPAIETLEKMVLRLLPARQREIAASLCELRDRIMAEVERDFDVAAAKVDYARVPVKGVPIATSPELIHAELTRLNLLRERIELVESGGVRAGFDRIPRVAAPSGPLSAAERKRMLVWHANFATVSDAHLVFLGGDEVYRNVVKRWRADPHPTPPGEAHQLLMERFGRIRSPLTVELALDMTVRSRAKGPAKAWLHEHAEEARPVLEKLAQGTSPLAVPARALLAAAS